MIFMHHPEDVIVARGLTKRFITKHKAAGLRGSMSSILSPKNSEFTAVNDVSFSVKRGDVLGFIGPNGAGKSTAIKMLIGILYPTSGSIDVLGYTPWKSRKELAMNIGVVFGQKPQLWYHLPPIDTFNLMSKIYEVPERDYRERLEYLVEMFDIDYLNTPVRKLSFGQRMRAEIVSSLLHKPKIIFLDEPTIGMDMIAKQSMQDLIKRLNKEEGTTVFLTSHDMDDVEKLCNRIIIINKGKLAFNDTLERLRRKYIFGKNVEVKFSKAPERFSFKGAKIVRKSEYDMTIKLAQGSGSIKKLLEYISENFEVLDINISEPEIEEIVAKIYKR